MMDAAANDISISFYKTRTPPSRYGKDPEKTTKTTKKNLRQKENTGSDRLLCRRCMFIITKESSRIAVNKAHCHTFANPHGIVFEIGCFQNAAGCALVGQPTAEFSWFPPNSWQVAICGSCLTHMGWRFTSLELTHFYGLILDRLIKTG